MFQVKTLPERIKISGFAADSGTILLNYRDGSGVTKSAVVPVAVGFVSEFVATKGAKNLEFVFLKSTLRQGEHRSPPKGYPEERSAYADPEHYDFPIDTHEHVRAAISYFDKHKWSSGEHKRRAAKRILSAAKKHGIAVDKDSDVAQAARGE